MKGNTYISNVLVSTSTGSRQVTMAVPIKSSDGTVLGEVQRNYDLEAMHELLAEHVNSSSLELSEMTNQISKTTEDVAHAVQEIASGATQQANDIQDASENVSAIGDAVMEMQGSTSELAVLAERMQHLPKRQAPPPRNFPQLSQPFQNLQTALNP